MNASRRFVFVLLALALPACRIAPPPPPFLTADELAVVVVRPSQEMALHIAQACEPVNAVTAGSDEALRQSAHRAGANLAEVLYDAGTRTAVLHACPPGFDAYGDAPAAQGTAAQGTVTNTSAQTVTLH